MGLLRFAREKECRWKMYRGTSHFTRTAFFNRLGEDLLKNQRHTTNPDIQMDRKLKLTPILCSGVEGSGMAILLQDEVIGYGTPLNGCSIGLLVEFRLQGSFDGSVDER